jgi:hypothetical protein
MLKPQIYGRFKNIDKQSSRMPTIETLQGA